MPYYNGKYLTDNEVEQISNTLFGEELDDFRSSLTSSNSGSDFVDSALIGGITGSALLGGLIGGDFVGGFIGEELFDDD